MHLVPYALKKNLAEDIVREGGRPNKLLSAGRRQNVKFHH